jgi:alkylhydroperoxidase/carboxymuconolactone decarboxylase family protein YurZ
MEEYKKRLRRLAMHDDAFVEGLLSEENAPPGSALDQRTAALARLAASVAVDAAPSSFQHTVEIAHRAGATTGEIVGTLEAVTPVLGAARVVLCAPKLALALGYDVEAALERLDP